MNRFKPIAKFLAALSAALLVFSSGTAAQATSWDFPTAWSVPDGSTLIGVNEASYFDTWNSWTSFKIGPSSGRGPEAHICPSGPDNANCDPAKYTIIAESILPFCSAASSNNCVEGLRLKQDNGDWVPGIFQKMTEGTTYQGNDALDLIGGTSTSLFTVPGIKHAGNADTYSVLVRVKQRYNATKQKFEALSVNAVVIPYSYKPGGSPPVHSESPGTDGIVRIGTRHDPLCAWAGSGYCGVAEDFSDGTRVELAVRLPNTLAGWFRGRITAPVAEISASSSVNNRLVLAADPVKVPRFAAFATAANSTARGIDLIKDIGGKNPERALFTGQAIRDVWATGYNTIEIMEEFKAASKDTAAGISSLWNFSTIDDVSNNKCMADTTKVLGIVSTNATAYNGRTPDFVNGQLTYTVAGLHYAPDGVTLNEGTYDLIMRSDVARCLYGFTSAPISATISVSTASGETKVATTTVKDDKTWLTLRAVGFTYSVPTISIKLTQAKAKKTLVCVRGKSIKKVTAVAPKCPAGYKKK